MEEKIDLNVCYRRAFEALGILVLYRNLQIILQNMRRLF